MTAQGEELASSGTPTSNHLILMQPRDPLVIRDARPFGAEPGAYAFSLPWPMPRTVAGTVRTHIGGAATPALNWHNHADTQRARQIVSRGPLMVAQAQHGHAWQVYVPAPRDVVFFRRPETVETLDAMVLRPSVPSAGSGCDLPHPDPADAPGYARALANTALLPLSVTEDVKPDRTVPPYWRMEDAVRWLSTTSADRDALPITEAPGQPQRIVGQGLPPVDTRAHVSIDPASLTNREGALFVTEGRAFRDLPAPDGGDAAVAMLCQVSTDLAWGRGMATVPLGGERRACVLTVDAPLVSWPPVQYPSPEALARADGLRLLLVTPALFAHGWLPAWIADGAIPGLRGLKLGVKLVGAAIDRRIPVSGWRLARRQRPDGTTLAEGPRAMRYAVPAGGVYFLEFAKETRPTREIWDKLWLAPISDRNDDRNDGFGLVLPGLWRYADSETGGHHGRR